VVAERALTARLGQLFGTSRQVRVGIGDDAAVVRNRAADSVVCCDPVVENVHFVTSDAPALVGRKAVNRNLADLAAMGAAPDWLLVSLVLPPDYAPTRRTALLRGIAAAARRANCTVVGGDLCTGPGPLVVTVTAIGHLVAARPLRRDGAAAGDTIHVSGALGGSRLGHHLRFTPPLREGAWLSRQTAVTAAIDVSDGLLIDLATVLAASGGLGAELDTTALPLRRAAHRLASGDRARAVRHALHDGEDHVLLWTVRGALPRGGPLTARARRPIGRVLDTPGLWLRGPDGRRRRVRPGGWQHRLA